MISLAKKPQALAVISHPKKALPIIFFPSYQSHFPSHASTWYQSIINQSEPLKQASKRIEVLSYQTPNHIHQAPKLLFL
jgi:hypothetical protein